MCIRDSNLSASFFVTSVDDYIDEDDETIKIEVLSVANANQETSQSVNLKIKDDDDCTYPVLVDGEWKQSCGELVGDNADDLFGYSTDISADGTVVAVGAKQSGDNDKDGYVKVFKVDNNGVGWTQIGDDITGKKGTYADGFGSVVSLSDDGTLLAVSAFNYYSDINSNPGIVQIFKWNGSSWVKRGEDIIGDNSEKLGQSLSLSSNGNVLAIRPQKSNSGTDSTHVKIYYWNNNSWEKRGDLPFFDIPNNV